MTDTTPAVRMPTDEMILAGAKAAQSAEAHHISWKDAALSVWSAMLAAAPVAPAGEGFTPVTGLWKDQSLSRVERVKAHRMEFGSELAPALEAVDEEADRQALRARSEPEAGAVGDEQIVNAMLRAAERAADREEPGFWQDRARAHIANARQRSLDHPEVQAAISEARQFLTDCGAHPAPSDTSATERMRAALVDAQAALTAVDRDYANPLPATTNAALNVIAAALGEA